MSLPPWSLVICSGGSGGHVFPALAALEYLQAGEHPPAQVLAFSTERRIEQNILASDAIEHVPLPMPAARDCWRNPFRAVANLRKSFLVAQRFLDDAPHPVVLGMGGFGSAPGVLAAAHARLPVILHEQNIVPGRATSWLARWASEICVSFPETPPQLKGKVPVSVTGNPVRREISELAASQNSAKDDVILVLGGSQGSQSLNLGLLHLAHHHRTDLDGWRVMHQSGESGERKVADGYRLHRIQAEVAAFFAELPQRYSMAQLAVTRGGATSLAELACAGIPAVIVPYPNSVRNHQLRNAEWYAAQGAAIVVEEQATGGSFGERLSNAVLQLLDDAPRRAAMGAAMRKFAQPLAAQRLAEVILRQVATKLADQ